MISQLFMVTKLCLTVFYCLSENAYFRNLSDKLWEKKIFSFVVMFVEWGWFSKLKK